MIQDSYESNRISNYTLGVVTLTEQTSGEPLVEVATSAFLANPELSRDSGCRHDLLWRIVVGEAVDLCLLVEHLIAAGWRDRTTMTFLRSVVSPNGHTVVIVPRTRRIQIRVEYVVPLAKRAKAAAEVANALVEMSAAQGVASISKVNVPSPANASTIT